MNTSKGEKRDNVFNCGCQYKYMTIICRKYITFLVDYIEKRKNSKKVFYTCLKLWKKQQLSRS